MPILISVLLIFFAWSLYKAVNHLFSYQTDYSYILFNKLGLPPLFLAFYILYICCDTLAILFILRPQPKAYYFLISYLIAPWLANIALDFLFGFSNIEIAKEAYVLSKQLQGKPVTETALTMFFTTKGLIIFNVLVGFLTGLGVWIVIRNRTYFIKAIKNEIQA